jgi:hypothetical protein
MRASRWLLALVLAAAFAAAPAYAQLPGGLPGIPPDGLPGGLPPGGLPGGLPGGGGGGGGGLESACCAAIPCDQDEAGNCTNENGGMACDQTVIIALDPNNPGPPSPPTPPAGTGGCVELIDIASVTDGLNGVICVGGGVDPASQSGGACACIGPLCGSGSGIPPTPDQTVEGCTANAVAGCIAAGAAHCANPDGDCG